MRSRLRALPAVAGVVLAVAASLALAGCSPTVDLHPAPAHANDPHCADVMVRLPGTLDSQTGTLDRRETDAQSTAAWGDPTSVILSCGVPVPGASTLPCIQIDNSVYWLRQEDTKQKVWIFTTFGRNPAAQLTVSTALSPGVVLDQLATDVDFLPKTGDVCTSTQDTVTGEQLPDGSTPTTTTSPTPTPSASASR